MCNSSPTGPHIYRQIIEPGSAVVGVEGGAQQDAFVGGAWQIPKRMADQLGDQVVLNAPVLAVEQHSTGVNVITAAGHYRAGIGVLVGFMDGDMALSMSALSEAARREQAIKDMVHYFGPEAATPIGYIEQDWTREAWSRGGYVAHMPPGVLTSFGDSIREPCGRIHWAGTETATESVGYVDGALQSGIRAASEVMAAQA